MEGKIKRLIGRLAKRIRRNSRQLMNNPANALHSKEMLFEYFYNTNKITRELRSVVEGVVRYNQNRDEAEFNEYLLKRNIHRIEKGLSNKDPKSSFALAYIMETVSEFHKLSQIKPEESHLLQWGYDVLNEYFSTVENSPEKIKAEKLFNDTKTNCFFSANSAKIPYRNLEIKRSTISYDQFLNLTKQRKSVRWFLNKKVPRSLLEQAMEAARFSPSACNRQAFRLEAIDDPELLDQVSRLPWGTESFADNIPVMGFFIGDLSAYFDERDRHLIYIDSSLFAMSFMLALETLGLSSCALNWPDIEQHEIQLEKALSLKKYERCTMAIAIGFPDPDGLVLNSERKNVNQLIKYNNVYKG